MFLSRGKNLMEKVNFVWEAIMALAAGLFTCYGLVFTRASKKEVDKIRQEIITKEDFKSIKEDMFRCLDTGLENLSTRIDDKFDTVINLLGEFNPSQKGKRRKR